jgi:hypothetical protein
MKLARNAKAAALVVAEEGVAVTVVDMAAEAVAAAVATVVVAEDAAVVVAEEAIAVTVEDMEAEAADEIVKQELYRSSNSILGALVYSAPFFVFRSRLGCRGAARCAILQCR